MIINLIKYAASEGLTKLAPFVTTLYVAKYLSPELFGKYSLVVVMFEICFIFISFNIQATTRIDFFKESKDRFEKIKQNHLLLSLFIAVVAFNLLFVVDEDDYLVVLILVISAMIRSCSVFILAIFQCSQRVNAYVFTNLIFVLTLSGGTFYFLNIGFNYYSWLFAMGIASLIQLIVATRLHGFFALNVYVPRNIVLSEIKMTFIPALLFMPQAIGWWLKTGADRAIISDSLGDKALGDYALGFQFASLILVLVTVINLAFVPELNKLLKGGDNIKAKLIIKYVTWFLMFCSIIVYFAGYLGITIFYSNDYQHSLLYFTMLAFTMLPQALMLLNINVLYYHGEGKYVAKLIFFPFLLQALTNILIVKYFEVIGIVICSFIVNIFVLKLVLDKRNKILK